MTKTISKVEQAKTIIAENPNSTRSELIKMFMEQIGMSKAGASTYAFNLAKNAPKAVRAKKEKKAKTEVKVEAVVEAPKTETVVLDKLALKRARDAARKREKRAAEKAAREQAAQAA